MRTTTGTNRRSQPAVWPDWWQVAVWIPAGFAATRLLSAETPLLMAIVALVALAALHGLTPGTVELVAGGGGLLLTVFDVVDRDGCGTVLHPTGTGVVLVYASLMAASAFVRLLGSAHGREMARHLLVGTAALQLSLAAVSSLGPSVTGADGPDTVPALHTVPVPAVVLIILVVATLVGLRAQRGFPILGVALLVALSVVAVADNPCTSSPSLGLVGSITFASVAWLAGRSTMAR